MISNSKWYTLTFSLIAHVVLVLCYLQYQFYLEKVNAGVRQSESIASYVYQENFLGLEFAHQSKSEQIAKVNSLAKVDHLEQKQITITPPQKSKLIPHQEQRKTSPSPQKNKEKSVAQSLKSSAGNDAIVAILNAAIIKAQHYPASALQMGREGKTIVKFLLQPTGHIQHLRIIKHSGTVALDEAAIAAVNNAAPFRGIDKYLTEIQEFQITVGFEI